MSNLECLYDRLNKSNCRMFCVLISKVISELRGCCVAYHGYLSFD